MGLKDRRQGTSQEALRVPADCPMFSKNPMLFEYLAGYENEKGKWTPGCKFSIWFEMGNVKVCINDDVRGEIGFVVLDYHLKLSQALEEVLEGSAVEWRKRPGK